jgi:hypothetical protein
VTDYVEGKLSGAEQTAVAANIVSTAPEHRAWRQAHEELVIIRVTDYVEGNLTGTAKSDVQAKVTSDQPEHRLWKQTHDEMTEARKAIPGIRKQKAPDTFVEDVTATIHKRSAGGFFGRRTFGDRVPFGALLIVAMLALGVVGYLMWSSPTGSLKVQKQPEAPKHKQLDIERP